MKGEIIFLGTGTSHGVPKIGCRCKVCLSDDPKDKRMRSSILIKIEKKSNILIDTSIDLRFQALKHNIDKIDAVLFTHYHADHIFGLDELRRFNEITGKTIPIYGTKDTLQEIRRIFSYVFSGRHIPGGGIPSLKAVEVNSRINIEGITFDRLEGKHGMFDVSGFRMANVVYFTDVKHISEKTLKKMEGLEILILGALRDTPHPTHFSIDEAYEIVKKIQPQKTYLTHISHEISHSETSLQLPTNVFLAYDGLKLEFEI
ncbi:MAG: MBL fold metallo-hydrolase [Candidatus Schekmanbacteria bacterium]|nr:MAG: MBL fold metallo-hydrolase [Candidatus Schekmanbacteria bacterium]